MRFFTPAVISHIEVGEGSAVESGIGAHSDKSSKLLSPGTVISMKAANGRYCKLDATSSYDKCVSTTAAPWDVQDAGGGYIALSKSSGRYQKLGDAESLPSSIKMKAEDMGKHTVVLKTMASGENKYCKMNEGDGVSCHSQQKDAEKFTITLLKAEPKRLPSCPTNSECKHQNLKEGWDFALQNGLDKYKNQYGLMDTWDSQRFGFMLGATPECAPGFDQELTALTLGLNAEVLASMATMGDARTRDGKSKYAVSKKVFQFLPKTFLIYPYRGASSKCLAEGHGSNVHGREYKGKYFQADITAISFLRTYSGGSFDPDKGPSSRRRYLETMSGDNCAGQAPSEAFYFASADRKCGQGDKDMKRARYEFKDYQGDCPGPPLLPEDRSLYVAMGLSTAFGLQNLQIVRSTLINFWTLWSSVIKSNFPPDMLVKTDTKEDVLKLADKLDFKSFSTMTPPVFWNGRCAFDSQQDDYFVGPPYANAYVGKGIIKGLQYRVLNESSMIAHYEGPGDLICDSQLDWEFKVCSTCDCGLPGRQLRNATGSCACPTGLIHMSINHVFLHETSSKKGCLVPGGWFTKFDGAFREYMTHVRASVLAKKLQCCSEKTFPQKEEARKWGVKEQARLIPNGGRRRDPPQKMSKVCTQDLSRLPQFFHRGAPQGKVPFDRLYMNKDNVGYCSLTKSDIVEYAICHKEKLPPVPKAAQKSAIKSDEDTASCEGSFGKFH